MLIACGDQVCGEYFHNGLHKSTTLLCGQRHWGQTLKVNAQWTKAIEWSATATVVWTELILKQTVATGVQKNKIQKTEKSLFHHHLPNGKGVNFCSTGDYRHYKVVKHWTFNFEWHQRQLEEKVFVIAELAALGPTDWVTTERSCDQTWHHL